MEIELKYLIPDDQIVPKLKTLRSVGRLTVSTGQMVMLRDTYYDTEDCHLLSSGLALRVRHFDEQNIISLKSITPPVGNLHQREEIEMRTPGITIDQPDTWPDVAFKDRIWRITGGRSLVRLFELHQQRFQRFILKGDLRIAEMSVDYMQCHHNSDDFMYWGLEIEITDSGTKQDLNRIRKRLENTFDILPEKRSKFEISMAFTQVPIELLGDTKRDEVQAPDIFLHDSMKTAALKTFRCHLDVMKQNDAGSYRGENIEFVHDMRVAIRRMRTAYRVFEPYIDDDMRPHLKTLKKTGTILGLVRDMDVFRENYEQFAAENNVKTAGSALTAAWNVAYISARNDLSVYLSSRRYLNFRKSFSQYLDHALGTKSTTPQVADQLRKILEERQQRCVSQYHDISIANPAPLTSYHQLRIYMKHFRYSTEYFQNILGEAGEQTINETKVVQDHLGALQDAVVAQKHVRTVLQWGSWYPPQQPYTLMPVARISRSDVGDYLSHIEALIDQLVETFPGVWENFNIIRSINILEDVV